MSDIVLKSERSEAGENIKPSKDNIVSKGNEYSDSSGYASSETQKPLLEIKQKAGVVNAADQELVPLKIKQKCESNENPEESVWLKDLAKIKPTDDCTQIYGASQSNGDQTGNDHQMFLSCRHMLILTL